MRDTKALEAVKLPVVIVDTAPAILFIRFISTPATLEDTKFTLVTIGAKLAVASKALAGIDFIPYNRATIDPLAILSVVTAFDPKTVDVTRVSAILTP